MSCLQNCLAGFAIKTACKVASHVFKKEWPLNDCCDVLGMITYRANLWYVQIQGINRKDDHVSTKGEDMLQEDRVDTTRRSSSLTGFALQWH